MLAGLSAHRLCTMNQCCVLACHYVLACPSSLLPGRATDAWHGARNSPDSVGLHESCTRVRIINTRSLSPSLHCLRVGRSVYPGIHRFCPPAGHPASYACFTKFSGRPGQEHSRPRPSLGSSLAVATFVQYLLSLARLSTASGAIPPEGSREKSIKAVEHAVFFHAGGRIRIASVAGLTSSLHQPRFCCQGPPAAGGSAQ